MPSQIMGVYYRAEAARLAAATKSKANLCSTYMDDQAKWIPTPTTAELNLAAVGSTPALAADYPAAVVKRPASCSLTLKRWFPLRTP